MWTYCSWCHRRILFKGNRLWSVKWTRFSCLCRDSRADATFSFGELLLLFFWRLQSISATACPLCLRSAVCVRVYFSRLGCVRACVCVLLIRKCSCAVQTACSSSGTTESSDGLMIKASEHHITSLSFSCLLYFSRSLAPFPACSLSDAFRVCSLLVLFSSSLLPLLLTNFEKSSFIFFCYVWSENVFWLLPLDVRWLIIRILKIFPI